MKMNNAYHFHQGWRFRLSGIFPMEQALDACRDSRGRLPTDPLMTTADWEEVTLPHTFNGGDLFAVPIEDGGSGQRRTCAFYRNTLRVPPEQAGRRVLITFEGVRQTCYLYVNGRLAGYYEMGVGPFGFDLTPFLDPSGHNTVAVATDNTSTRNIPFCIAETPNAPGVQPGSYLLSQEERVPEDREGVGFFWNCNDFNPTLGGISKPLRVVFKPDLHLTLPLYANLQSHGTYVWADEFDLTRHSARVHVEAEVRNLSGRHGDLPGPRGSSPFPGKEIGPFSSENGGPVRLLARLLSPWCRRTPTAGMKKRPICAPEEDQVLPTHDAEARRSSAFLRRVPAHLLGAGPSRPVPGGNHAGSRRGTARRTEESKPASARWHTTRIRAC